jgi:hypothetical protein
VVSTENKQMAEFFGSMTERMSRSDLDLATIRDVYENLHLAAREPECVSYAEVDIDGVPALWCVPTDCDVNRVLLHAHGGGTVRPATTQVTCFKAGIRIGIPWDWLRTPGGTRVQSAVGF